LNHFLKLNLYFYQNRPKVFAQNSTLIFLIDQNLLLIPIKNGPKTLCIWRYFWRQMKLDKKTLKLLIE
jgi:hypothetical protein